MNKAAILVGAALMISQSAVAAAAEMDSPPYVRVSVADLNLYSPEGRAALDSRILVAARRVCADAEASGPLSAWAKKQCIGKALSGAMRQRDHLLSTMLPLPRQTAAFLPAE